MPSDNIKKIVKTNKIVSLKTVYTILFLILILILGSASKYLYDIKTDEYKQKIYKKLDSNVLERFEMILQEKLNTSLLVSSSLSKNDMIKQALINQDKNILDMDKLLEEMRTKREYVDIQAEVIDANGVSFKRSWTETSGDDLVKNNLRMEHLIKYPTVYTGIESTKYGMTFTNKIPIYDDNKFLGYFGVNIHFDAIVDIFAQNGYKIVILMNREDSKKIQQGISYSEKFINNCYVVNANADEYLLRLIKESDMEEFCNEQQNKYIVEEKIGDLISKFSIKNGENQTLAKAIIYKSLDEIDFGDLEFIQKLHIMATVFFGFILLLLIKYIYMASAYKEKSLQNEELLIINKVLEEKTDELDFNDKKLDNLFNMQPNLMFMHNGKEITKANKRFMGFFNRFGTFEGFKKKHKCVSELFEKYEAPNYIWEQYIEGEFWIDYLLQNPRKLYKTVLSINGDPHHFIIKFNEMEYSKHVADRIIIVALVDMTQDLVNYKSIKETSSLLKDINITEKLELNEEKQNTDISFEIVEECKNSIKEFTLEDSINVKIVPMKPSDLPKDKIIKIGGSLKFIDVESSWNYFIPTTSTYKILNLLSKEKFKVENKIDKDQLDTAREWFYTFSTNLSKTINSKNFHDLQNAQYTQSEVSEITKKDLLKMENFYKITIVLENETVDFYTQFDKDVIPFISMIVENKEIIPYIVEKKADKEEIKIADTTNEPVEKTILAQKEIKKVEEKLEEKKEVEKPKEIKEAEKQEEKKETQKNPTEEKLNIYSLIQDSLAKTLNETLDSSIQKLPVNKLDNQKIQNLSGIKYENSLTSEIDENVSWQFFIPVTTLSILYNMMIDDIHGQIVQTIDDGLKEISKQIVISVEKNMGFDTNNKVKSHIIKENVVDSINNIKLYEVYDLGMVINKRKLPIYLLMKRV